MKLKLRTIFKLTLLYIFIYRIVLLKIQAPFTIMYIVGDILYNLVIGYCASYIFYLIFSNYQREKEQKLLKLVLSKPLTYVISNIQALINNLVYTALGNNKDFNNLTKDDFKNICNKINPFATGPIGTIINGKMVNLNYLSYLNNYINVVNKACGEILDFTKILDDELIILINSIKKSSYHEQMEFFSNISNNCSNTNLDFLVNEIFDYYNACKSLKEYVLKNKLIDSQENL